LKIIGEQLRIRVDKRWHPHQARGDDRLPEVACAARDGCIDLGVDVELWISHVTLVIIFITF